MNRLFNIASLTVDELIIFRARLLLFGAVAFALWQFGWLAVDEIAESKNGYYGVAVITTVSGALGWVVTTVMLLKFNQRINNTNTAAAVHDELVVKNRNSAFFHSYFVLFGLIWLLIPMMDAWLFDAKVAVRMVATIAIILPMVLFAVYELNDCGDGE